MPKIQFIGRVLPEAIKVSVQAPELKWKCEALGVEPIFRVKIGNSFVNVECEIEKFDPSYVGELYRRALDLARASTNLVAFATGYGLTVILETMIDPVGTPSSIAPIDPAIAPLCTAFSLEPARQDDFNATFRVVLAEPPLFRSLDDLIAAITLPHVSLVNCGRVIDAIRRMISPALEGAAAWQAMHQALNISRPYQEWISQQSTGPRHANPEFVAGNITTEVTHRTWAIMNRFLEYRKCGNQLLTVPNFPQL